MRSFRRPLQKSQMVTLSRKKFSDETMKKVHWARRMYSDWRFFRNSQEDLRSFECDLDNVITVTKSNLNEALCRFITEVKKVDGSEFPSRTLYDIVICLQFWLETQGFAWKLLNEDEFQDLRFTLHNVMKERVENGIGCRVRKAEVLTFTDEDLLWSLGLLGTHSPEVLLHTVLFSLGLHCALRAGKEHRALRSIPFESQFQFMTSSDGITFIRYTEDVGLKTNKGGIKHRKLSPKSVDMYPGSNIDRCPVRIFAVYLSMLPAERKCKALYLQPRKKFCKDSWYLDGPVGANSLKEVVGDVCKKANLPGYYTNHSLRSSSATRMYHSGIDEQVIQEITGHRSLAVRSYKRTSDIQKRQASLVLSGGIGKN